MWVCGIFNWSLLKIAAFNCEETRSHVLFKGNMKRRAFDFRLHINVFGTMIKIKLQVELKVFYHCNEECIVFEKTSLQMKVKRENMGSINFDIGCYKLT